MTKISVENLPQMAHLGACLAAQLRAGDIVTFKGDLGAGKTTLVRHILHGLGYNGDVPSPSFAIMQYYEPPAISLPVVHADFYRLNDPDETEELGLYELLDDAALLAEWPQMAHPFTTDNVLHITIEQGQDAVRSISFAPNEQWHKRLTLCLEKFHDN